MSSFPPQGSSGGTAAELSPPKYCPRCYKGLYFSADDRYCSFCEVSDATLLPTKSAGMGAGRLLAGRFVLSDERIGKGAFGVVHKAFDTDSGEDTPGVAVAVKVLLLPEDEEEADKLRTFAKAEIEALRRIDSDYVVKIRRGVETEHDLTYFVMDLLSGQTLAAFLRGTVRPPGSEERGLDLPSALNLFSELASAVEVLHKAGVWHRDLKPENIMLTHVEADASHGKQQVAIRGRVHIKLLDFGSAKYQDTGQTRIQLYTEIYAAPEQRQRQTVGKPADVFTLGLLFLSLLPGSDLMPALRQGDESRISALRERIGSYANQLSPELIRLLRSCVSVEPRARPADGSALVEAIDQLPERRHPTGGASAAAPTVPSPAHRPHRIRRIVGLVAIGAFLPLGLLIWINFNELLRAQAARILASALRAERPRAAAITWAGKSRQPRLVPAVRASLESKEPAVVAAAAEALLDLEEADKDALLQVLARATAKPVKLALAAALSRISEADGCATIRELLGDSELGISRQAAHFFLRRCSQRSEPDWTRVRELLSDWAMDESDPAAREVLCELARRDAKNRASLQQLLQQRMLAAVFTEASVDAAYCLASTTAEPSAFDYLAARAGEPGPQRILAARRLSTLKACGVYGVLDQAAFDGSVPLEQRLHAIAGRAECGLENPGWDSRLLYLFVRPGISEPLRTALAGAYLRMSEDPEAAQKPNWGKHLERQLRDLQDGANHDRDLAQMFAQAPQAIRDQLIQLLRMSCADRDLAQLAIALSDPLPQMRLTALHSLSHTLRLCKNDRPAEARAELLIAFRKLAATASGAEQAIATLLLAHLGESGLGKSSCITAAEAPVRRICAELWTGDVTPLRALLTDADVDVRVAAGTQLATKQDSEGLRALGTWTDQGGAIGLRALIALLRLGGARELPPDFAEQYRSEDLPLRFELVLSLRGSRLPSAFLLSILRIAKPDPAAVIRRQVAIVAADRHVKSGEAAFRHLWDPDFLFDEDASVRDKARELLRELNGKVFPATADVPLANMAQMPSAAPGAPSVVVPPNLKSSSRPTPPPIVRPAPVPPELQLYNKAKQQEATGQIGQLAAAANNYEIFLAHPAGHNHPSQMKAANDALGRLRPRLGLGIEKAIDSTSGKCVEVGRQYMAPGSSDYVGRKKFYEYKLFGAGDTTVLSSCP